MRMTRARRRRMLCRQAPEYHKGKRIAVAMMVSMSAALPIKGQAAITVLQDIKSDFDYMENSFANIKALDAAKEYVVQAESNVAIAQEHLLEAEEACLYATQNQTSAKENVAGSVKQLQEAKDILEELKKKNIAAQQAVADYTPTWYKAQAELQHRLDVQQAAEGSYEAGTASGVSKTNAQTAQWVADAWAQASYEDTPLSTQEIKYSDADGDDIESADAVQEENKAYLNYMAELRAATDTARKNFEAINARMDNLKIQHQESEEAESKARQELIQLQVLLGQNQQELLEAGQETLFAEKTLQDAESQKQQANIALESALQDLVKAQYGLQHFGEGKGYQKSLEYYSWQGAKERSGHQLYSGNSFYWIEKNYEFALNNGTVISHTGLENGNMSGLTDTTISAMYTNKHPIFDVKYGLEINLPTGSSRIHPNAIVPDYLARCSRLSEGWNFTPKVDVTKHVGKYTSWHWRSSYSLRGAYEEEYAEGIGVMHPGDQWSTELELLHTDPWQQYMLRLQYVNNDNKSVITGLENEDCFVEGDNLNARAYGRFWFTPRDSWALYTIWSLDKAAVYENIDRSAGCGIHRLYYGAGYYHQFDDKNQLRLFGNWLHSNGEASDPLTRQNYVSGRRFSVSLGYDWKMDARNSLSLDVERAVLRQQGDENYRIWGIMLNYNRSF